MISTDDIFKDDGSSRGRLRGTFGRLRDLGVPQYLFSSCFESASLGLFVRVTPHEPLEAQEVSQLAALGLGLSFENEVGGRLDLADYAVSMQHVKKLWLDDFAEPIDGLAWVKEATLLETIYAGRPWSSEVNLSALPNLRQATLKGTGGLSATLNPSLRELNLEIDSIDANFMFEARLESLFLTLNNSDLTLQVLADPSLLSRVDIRRAARLDVAALGRATRLRHLRLYVCRDVYGLEQLAALPELASLEIEDARSIRGIETVEEMDLRRLLVDPNPGLNKDSVERMRRSFNDKGLKEAFYVAPPAFEEKAASKSLFETSYLDGSDVTTFAPLSIHELDDASFEIELAVRDIPEFLWQQAEVEPSLLGGEALIKMVLGASSRNKHVPWEFDSESDVVRLVFGTKSEAEQAAKALYASLEGQGDPVDPS